MLVISGCCGNGKMQFVVSVGDNLARAVSLLHTLSADMDLFLQDCVLCCFFLRVQLGSSMLKNA